MAAARPCRDVLQILGAIRRSQFKELSVPTLMARKLKHSVFSAGFHVLDVLGAGLVTAVPSTSGLLLRCKDK